jgi:hypothetical protein
VALNPLRSLAYALRRFLNMIKLTLKRIMEGVLRTILKTYTGDKLDSYAAAYDVMTQNKAAHKHVRAVNYGESSCAQQAQRGVINSGVVIS